ncbi:hypothetical protein ACIQVR_32895 [Streptomyces xanthochromogenes]|uniref:hypothetical protein n=1 Tax=Streptomyces xanthochromogenes TaxID=67384 RepID=UPI00382D9788
MSSTEEPPDLPDLPDLPDPAGPRRAQGRTARIVVGAAALGVLAGTVTGYVVQYQRQPTPLAPLAQPNLAESRTTPADESTTPRTVSADRWAEKPDGDLRHLLLPKPPGAKVGEEPGYRDLATTVEDFAHPDKVFTHFLRDGFRREVTTSWTQGGHVGVTVSLTQFRDDVALKSKDYVDEQQDAVRTDAYAGNPGKPIPGNVGGRTYVYAKPYSEPGYEPVYQGRAYAWRDGTAMEIYYEDSTGPVSESALQALAEQQLERL